MSPRTRLAVASVAALVLLAPACGGDDDTSTTAASEPAGTEAPPATDAATTTAAEPSTTQAATTTTLDPAEAAMAYTEPGPYPVGITTLQLAKGPLVEVWYPAVDGTTGTDSYDVRDYVPDSIRALLTADIPATFTIDAGRDAAAADGPFPLVLFSHGFTGIRVQSSFLTSHLASWGFVVASPEHPSRDLTNVLGATASGDRGDSVDDLLQTLDLMETANTTAGDPLEGRIDTEQVAAVGHSAGGFTVLGAAQDPAVDGYVSLASGAAIGSSDASTTSAPPVLPDKPSFFMAGSDDGVVPAETVTRPAFEAVPAPSLLWIIEGVGHNGFDDFCTFGNGSGIIGLAEASGLGGLLDAQPSLRRLGQDGCLPPSVPVTETFSIINHGVTSWLRSLFGIDPEPVGLGPEVADAYAHPVEIQVRS